MANAKANAKRSTRGPAVQQYQIGKDFPQEYIEALTYKIALWFASPTCDRKYADPVGAAKAKIKECLLATTEDGSAWKKCPASFEMRVKAKCGYDIAADRGIPAPRVKHPEGGRDLNPAAQQAAKGLKDADVVNAGFDAEGFRARVEADILAAFSELDNPAHKPNVRSLSGLYAEREKINAKLAVGVTDVQRELLLKSLKMIEEMADTTLKRLGIHPDQIRKKISDRAASTVADLVASLDGDDDFRHREKVWALQLALQLWWMSEHHNGDRTGPNISDFECWHMTRSRPMKFRCRHGEDYTLVEGFEPADLYRWLTAEGVLVHEPLLPQITPKDALDGLDAFFAADDAAEPEAA